VIEVREMQRSPPIHRFKIVLPLCDTGANPGSKWSFGLFADAAGTSSEYLAAEDPELDVIFLEGPSGESYTWNLFQLDHQSLDASTSPGSKWLRGLTTDTDGKHLRRSTFSKGRFCGSFQPLRGSKLLSTRAEQISQD